MLTLTMPTNDSAESTTLAEIHARTELELLRLGREIENDPTCRPGSGCGDGMSRVDVASGKRRALTNIEMSAVLRWANHKEKGGKSC